MTTVQDALERIEDLTRELGEIKGQMANYASAMQEQEIQFKDKIQRDLAAQKTAIMVIINDANAEFKNVNDRHQGLIEKLELSVAAYETRFEGLQGQGGPGADSSKPRGYLPQKNMIPNTFSDQPEQ